MCHHIARWYIIVLVNSVQGGDGCQYSDYRLVVDMVRHVGAEKGGRGGVMKITKSRATFPSF